MHLKITVDVEDQGVVLGLHGMNLQRSELEVVARTLRRVSEELEQEVGGVDLEFLRELVAEKGLEEEV